MATQPAEHDEESPDRRRGEMTIIEHLIELRSRVMWISIAVVGGMVIFFIPPIGFGFIEWLEGPAKASDPDFKPQFIEPMENLVTFFRVALLGGVTVGMPMIVYQSIRFVGPALTPTEKRWMYPIVIGASLSFVGGLAFAYYVILPPALDFLLNFGSDVAEPEFRIGNYISFVTRIMLIMGLVFQTPIVIMGLAKLRVVHWRKLRSMWRVAIVGAFVISAVVTPTIDPITQSLVAGPMIVLYFVGIGLAWVVRPRVPAEEPAEEAES